MPTSLFSNHTGFPVHFMHDCTPYLRDYLAAWKKLGFRFDGIYCGFLGSAGQIDIVREFLADWPGVPFILDPVMGDHGKAYRTVTAEHCEGMKALLSRAAIITPNITEACLLTGTSLPGKRLGQRGALPARQTASCHGPGQGGDHRAPGSGGLYQFHLRTLGGG